MPLGVDKTKKTIEAVSAFVADVVTLSRAGISLNSLPKVFEIIMEIKSIAESAPGSLPELKDLEEKEAAELGGAAYLAICKILAQIKAKPLAKPAVNHG